MKTYPGRLGRSREHCLNREAEKDCQRIEAGERCQRSGVVEREGRIRLRETGKKGPGWARHRTTLDFLATAGPILSPSIDSLFWRLFFVPVLIEPPFRLDFCLASRLNHLPGKCSSALFQLIGWISVLDDHDIRPPRHLRPVFCIRAWLFKENGKALLAAYQHRHGHRAGAQLDSHASPSRASPV